MTMMKLVAELRALTTPELVARYEAAYGRPPRSRSRPWLWKRIAWKVQEGRSGGLSTVARRNLDALMTAIDWPPAGTEGHRDAQRDVRTARDRDDLPIGSVLVREWRGRTLRVQVLDDGYEHDGTKYRTLSAAAKAISGTHCSGPAFFGLTGRRKAKES